MFLAIPVAVLFAVELVLFVGVFVAVGVPVVAHIVGLAVAVELLLAVSVGRVGSDGQPENKRGYSIKMSYYAEYFDTFTNCTNWLCSKQKDDWYECVKSIGFD